MIVYYVFSGDIREITNHMYGKTIYWFANAFHQFEFVESMHEAEQFVEQHVHDCILFLHRVEWKPTSGNKTFCYVYRKVVSFDGIERTELAAVYWVEDVSK